MFTFPHHEFAGSKKTSIGNTAGCINRSVARACASLELREEGSEDGESDGLHRFPIFLAMIDLDSADEVHDNGRFAGCERDVSVSVEGAHCCDVCFDCLGLNATTEVCNPRHDSSLRGGEDGAVGIVLALKLDKVDERSLAGRIHALSTCCKTMP